MEVERCTSSVAAADLECAKKKRDMELLRKQLTLLEGQYKVSAVRV